MPALFFPNPDALRLVLASGIVPHELTQLPTRAGLDDHGRLWLALRELPPRDTLAALARLGVRALGEANVPTERVGCWAELLPLRRSPVPHRGTYLFEMPDSHLAAFTAGLRRLAASPVGVRLLPAETSGRAWVTVESVPVAVMLGCEERDAVVSAFAQQSPGVWVRAGWEHPLPDRLVLPADHVLLLGPPRSVVARPGPVPVPAFDEYALPRRAVRPVPVVERPAVAVPFTLTRAAEVGHELLWVFAGDALEGFREFCRTADQRLLDQFEAATVARGEETRVVVRAIGGLAAIPILPLARAGYTPDARLESLFVPIGRELRPAVRVKELVRLLEVGPGRVTWVEPAAGGGVVAHSIPTVAFGPVAELLDYVTIEQVPFRPALGQGEPFPFDRFALLAVEDDPPVGYPDDRQSGRRGGEQEQRRDVAPGWLARSIERLASRFRRSTPKPPAPPPTGTSPPVPQPPSRRKRPAPFPPARVEQQLSSADALVHGHNRAIRRRELEGQLLDEFPRLGPERRAERWAELAAVYGATGSPGNAAICWINAIWEAAAPPDAWLEQWFLAECRVAKQTGPVIALDRWLSEPGRFGVGRVVAAYAVWGSHQSPPRRDLLAALPRVLAFLDQHFDDLPARAAWLARLAVTRLCDGDALGLARWRDRVLARLRDKGPGLDLDEPSFLRFHGTAEPERFQTAREWLVRARDPILKWVNELATPGRLQFAGIDPEVECTAEYAQLMLAWGLGQLGERTRSLDWAARARKVLARPAGPLVDLAVHSLLGDLFLHRIRDAQEGRVARPGLPAELQSRYDRLSEFSRYAVDKCRRFVRILEPVNRVREYTGKEFKEFWGHDRLGERLFVLTDRADPAYLTEEARTLLDACAAEPSSELVPRITFTLLEVAPHLHPPVIPPLLAQVVPALDWLETWLLAGRWDDAERPERLLGFQSRLLENAFAAAVCFNQIGAARPLVAHLLRRAPADPTLRAAITRAAGPLFRSFRKLGCRAEAGALSEVLDVERDAGWPREAPFPPSRLGLAVGWFAAGDEDAGNRILNEARDRLYLAGRADERDRTRLAIAYAEALGFAPPRIALGRLEEIFQRLDRVTVTGSTNRYFTLKPLELIDTVIRSVVTEDFALGPAVRGWLDDDEFLIRRRIHRDMAAVLRDGGLG